MRVLVDTHVIIWWTDGQRGRIKRRARQVIEDPDVEVFVSHVSIWEMSIKLGLGKLELPVSLDAFMVYAAADLGHARQLPMRPLHLEGVQHLPSHHRDPFDRLLVCQARHESMALVSADARFDAYGVRRIWD